MAPNEKSDPLAMRPNSRDCGGNNKSVEIRDASDGIDVKSFYSSYRPLMDNPIRRMSIYQWIKGKIKDDNIGYTQITITIVLSALHLF